MIKSCLVLPLLILGCVLSTHRLWASPPGFLWYNVPKPQMTPKKQGVPFKSLSYTDRDAVLKFYTLEALHKVRFTHRMDDERVFLAMQDYWLREASAHGQLNQKTLLYYPEYDFSVTHPTSAIGTQLSDALRDKKHASIIKEMASTHGILFFYRADNPYDQKEIPIVRDFCDSHGFSLIPVSVDGGRSPLLKHSRVDSGQADALGVRYFPALLLVNPKGGQVTPLAYGLTTQDVLKRRVVSVATQFKGVDGEI